MVTDLTHANIRTGTYVAMCAVLAACVVTMTVVYVRQVHAMDRKWDEHREKIADSLTGKIPPPAAHTDN